MSTYESVKADIKQLLDEYDKYVKLVELESWLKNVSVEDIKSSFKLSGYIEESINNLQTKQCADLFMQVLFNWWKKEGRSKVYAIEYFSLASDHLLSKFFTSRFVSVSTLDVAIRIYTTMYPKERFQSLLKASILNSASIEAMIDYTIINKNSINVKELESGFLLRHWSAEIECGRKMDVVNVITSMLSSYKVETSLCTLITVLTLKDVTERETGIQNMILEKLELQMLDRSILSKQLWLALFKYVDKKQLCDVCARYGDFSRNLFDFIIYIGCMMNCETKYGRMCWVSDPNISICPELTYNDLKTFIKFYCDYSHDLRNYSMLRISEAMESTDSEIWRQLESDLV